MKKYHWYYVVVNCGEANICFNSSCDVLAEGPDFNKVIDNWKEHTESEFKRMKLKTSSVPMVTFYSYLGYFEKMKAKS